MTVRVTRFVDLASRRRVWHREGEICCRKAEFGIEKARFGVGEAKSGQIWRLGQIWLRAQGPWPMARCPRPTAQGLNLGKTHFVPKWRKLRNSDTQNRYSANPSDRELNLLSNDLIESFWGTLWLGIQAFLCFSVECRRIVICGMSLVVV